jgi:predicted phosphodiesterase
MTRIVFVGDVHGCADELEDLLSACAFSSSDALVLVGDLVAKGPDSRRVLALVRKYSARSVKGNHDHAVLRWRDMIEQGKAPAHGPHHLKVARSLSDDDWQTLLALPLWLTLPEANVIVVHAGLLPGLPIDQQEPDLLMNMRTIRSDGSGSRRAEDGVLWGSLWPGPELVVFGHHATQGLQRHTHAVGLDSGCVYGGKLSAYVWPDDRIVSVPARKAYVPLSQEAPSGAGS